MKYICVAKLTLQGTCHLSASQLCRHSSLSIHDISAEEVRRQEAVDHCQSLARSTSPTLTGFQFHISERYPKM